MLDLRYASASLARARGFAVAVVLTLGLGIVPTTAIFSVIRGVMLKPLPNRDGDRLMYLRHSMNRPGGDNIAFSVPEINDFSRGVQRRSAASPSTRRTRSRWCRSARPRGSTWGWSRQLLPVMGLSPEVGGR